MTMKNILLTLFTVIGLFLNTFSQIPSLPSSFNTTPYNGQSPRGWFLMTGDVANYIQLNEVGHYVLIDLGNNVTPTGVTYTIFMSNDNSKTVLVEHSTDATTWTTAATITNATAGIRTAPGITPTTTIPSTAKYIRFRMSVRAGGRAELTNVTVNGSGTNNITYLIDPIADGGFETGTTFGTNNWITANNGGHNRWHLGARSSTNNGTTNYNSGGGTRTAYVSNNSSAYSYTISSQTTASHLYQYLSMPAGATDIKLTFLLRSVGEQTNYDQLLVFTGPQQAPPNITFTSTTMTGYTTHFIQNSTSTWANFQYVTVTLPNTLAGTNFSLVFTWKNDASAGISPPAAIDNIGLTYLAAVPPSCATTPTPINGGTNILVNQQLSWSATAGATGYDVYFGTTTTPPIVSTNQAGTTYNPGTLNPNTTYYWRIIPRNSSGSATGCTNWSFTTGLAGCLDAPNGLWPSATFTPTCGPTAQDIVINAYTGEYSNVNLNNGTTYRFSSSVSTDYVTISNSTGTIILASGLTPLTWKSNTTGTVRYYLHNNTACGSSTVERIKSIQCIETPCINNTPYTVEVMPIQPNPIVTTLCSSGFGQLTNEYSEWNGGASNTTYITTSSVTTDWVTVTQGTFNGTIVSFGSSPLTWEANSDGKYFVHVNRNRYCEQDGVNCRNITLERVSSLPVTLKSFYGETKGTTNIINWVTSSEKNSQYFMVEFSYDGIVWSLLENVLASGNTQSEIKYVTYDNNVNKTKFYRLTQYDVDGSFEIFNPIIINRLNSEKKILKYVNVLGQEVNYDSTGGVIFVVYDDGTSVKTIR